MSSEEISRGNPAKPPMSAALRFRSIAAASLAATILFLTSSPFHQQRDLQRARLGSVETASSISFVYFVVYSNEDYTGLHPQNPAARKHAHCRVLREPQSRFHCARPHVNMVRRPSSDSGTRAGAFFYAKPHTGLGGGLLGEKPKSPLRPAVCVAARG